MGMPFFLSFGVVGLALNLRSAERSVRSPVHICRAECIELARKQQGERIFAKGEYPAC